MKKNKMENKQIDLTVLVPVTKLDNQTTSLLNLAIGSIKDQTLHPKKVVFIVPTSEIETYDYITSTFENSNGLYLVEFHQVSSDDFPEMVNTTIDNVSTKYFSILEWNSEYLPTYFERTQEFIDSSEFSGMATYLPTTALVTDKGFMLQFINEGVWGQGESEAMGKLDFKYLWDNNVFVLGGMVMSKEAFQEVGGFKSEIKIYFAYEFLLRLINSDYKVAVTPKIGYKHTMDSTGSLFSPYKNAAIGIKQEEVQFYLDSAKKEYLFNPNEIKREINYSENEV